MTGLRALYTLVIAAAALPAPARGQAATSKPAFAVRIEASDLLLLGAGTAGAAALISHDPAVARWMRRPSLQQNTVLHWTMTGARLFGDPGAILMGTGLWAGGALTRDQTASNDGLRALEAVATASVVTWAVKGSGGRARPDVDSTNASDWQFGRGFRAGGQYQSFPSGHTAAAFAFASAITARLADRWPADARWAGPLLYGVAALTGVSRVYHHAHWMSDALVGAAIGTVSGLVIVRSHGR